MKFTMGFFLKKRSDIKLNAYRNIKAVQICGLHTTYPVLIFVFQKGEHFQQISLPRF